MLSDAKRVPSGASPRDNAPEIAFLFIGGAHQVLHLAPVAAELSRSSPAVRVTCLYADTETGTVLEWVRRTAGATEMRLEHVPVPWWGRILERLFHRHALIKGPLLLKLAGRLRRAVAVVVPERTSTVLRLLGLKSVKLIHFRHGAGDRAPRSERRMHAFDLLVVPGKKDVERAERRYALHPSRVAVCGYVKLDFLSRVHVGAKRLFEGARPVVLYNPHFDPALSSWHAAREVIAAFKQQDRYNLVVAPHVRIGEDLTAEARAEWEALAVPGRIIVDLASHRLIDMTYTAGADIYLGDVSSQLYEFLHRPRPVAFLDVHGVEWANDLRYAGWHLGEVATHPDEVLTAIDRAVERHDEVRSLQVAKVGEAFGPWNGASQRGARIVENFLGLEHAVERL